MLYSVQLPTYLGDKSLVQGGEKFMVNWLNSFFFLVTDVWIRIETRNVRLSSVEVYVWIEGKRCGRRDSLNAFILWHAKQFHGC